MRRDLNTYQLRSQQFLKELRKKKLSSIKKIMAQSTPLVTWGDATPKNSESIPSALIICADYCNNDDAIGAFVALTAARYKVDVLGAGKQTGDKIRSSIFVQKESTPLASREYRGRDLHATTNEQQAAGVEYAAVVVTGGRDIEQVRMFPEILAVLKKALSRPRCAVAAISNGSVVLTAAGVTGVTLNGSNLTRADIEKENVYSSDRVVVAERSDDRSIITGPSSHLGIILAWVIGERNGTPPPVSLGQKATRNRVAHEPLVVIATMLLLFSVINYFRIRKQRAGLEASK